jgi:hypothetical protein
MEKVFKTKYEYCHIYSDRIVISKTPEVEDLVADYSKSINDFFKSLMVFLVFIPLFTVLSAVLYINDLYGTSIYAGAFALFFLSMAFYLMLFTSGSPVIYKDKIVKVKFKKTLLFNVVEIKYKDFGRIKKRGLLLTNDQIGKALEILLAEELIEERNIEYNGKKIELFSYIFMAIFGVLFYLFMDEYLIKIPGDKGLAIMTQYGFLIIIVAMFMFSLIIRNLASSYYRNIKKPRKQ